MRLSFIVAACLLAALGFVQRTEQPQAQQISAVPAVDSVQVEHRLLTVEPAPAPQPRVVRAAQKPRAVTQTATPPRPFLARARQLVLGDGRFRPEPFPRPTVR